MRISRAEFSGGYAHMYNEFNQKYHSFPCSSLVGYGSEGIIVKRGTLYVAIDMNCRQRMMPEFVFNREQFALHDGYLQVRV